jgi:hypothetical protein
MRFRLRRLAAGVKADSHIRWRRLLRMPASWSNTTAHILSAAAGVSRARPDCWCLNGPVVRLYQGISSHVPVGATSIGCSGKLTEWPTGPHGRLGNRYDHGNGERVTEQRLWRPGWKDPRIGDSASGPRACTQHERVKMTGSTANTFWGFGTGPRAVPHKRGSLDHLELAEERARVGSGIMRAISLSDGGRIVAADLDLPGVPVCRRRGDPGWDTDFQESETAHP